MRRIFKNILITVIIICCALNYLVLFKLVVGYYMFNGNFIKTVTEQYVDNLSVNRNSSDQLFFDVREYFKATDNRYLVIIEATFTPEDCIRIMHEFEEGYEETNNGFKLGFCFGNGTDIIFDDFREGKFHSVTIDNSQAYGYIIPNISYYSDYEFDDIYLYGPMNDYGRFGEKTGHADLSFLKRAIDNSRIFMDQYTYDASYKANIKNSMSFGQMIESLSEKGNHVCIINSNNEYAEVSDTHKGVAVLCGDDLIGLWSIDAYSELPLEISYPFSSITHLAERDLWTIFISTLVAQVILFTVSKFIANASYVKSDSPIIDQ